MKYLSKSLTIALLILFTLGSCAGDDRNEIAFPGSEWGVMDDPEAYGWSVEGLRKARELTDELDTASIMIIHKGKVVDSWGDLDYKYRCHSMRKSFLSALYGIQVSEGAIDLDATMEQLEIDDNEGLSDSEKNATVQMLLQARSGIYHPALFDTAAMTAAKPERYSHAPGTNYHYNNWDFNASGTIYEMLSGESIHES